MDGNVEENVRREDPVAVFVGKVDAFQQVDHLQVDAMHLQAAQGKGLLALLLDSHEQVDEAVCALVLEEILAVCVNLAAAFLLNFREKCSFA